ncbi:TIGR03086 family protein [Kribbella antibiotica]|uniref:TIGR03086 family protein n=1 Tax=Kribbella antibiotica TaxID=190195 RepID=A0A4R4ZKD5_9ACTN|nr:TIGR03086 family metal-binding protein [Kribbella antibiotica]TDD59241.1 TIGR03086 family protein [Kribbella antibiotica]
MSTIDFVALDRRAVTASIELATRVTAADLTKPTPCRAWTVYGLLAHMTTQHYGFATASRGDGDPESWKLRDLGENAVQAYIESAEHVLAAFAEDGVTERIFPLPEFGPDVKVPGHQAISFHFIDYVVHSWDLAKALGTTVDFTPDVLDAAWTVAQIVPVGEARLTPGAAFGPDINYTGTEHLDRIVALLGRSPEWPAT